MTKNISRQSVIISLFWKSIERTSTQFINFGIQIILIRLLTPDDFGAFGIIMVFINFFSILVNGGFSTALIRKKEVSDEHYSTVFITSSIISIILYISLFLLSPFLEFYFNINNFALVLRVLGLNIIFNALFLIQNVIIARRMLYKELFLCVLVSTIISGVVGIYLAYSGFGLWSLVILQLSNQLLLVILLWFRVKWNFVYSFSKNIASELISFGWKILSINLLNSIHENIRNILIGKRYSLVMLGYYEKGNMVPQVIINNVTVTIQSIMLPTFSAFQDDKQKLKQLLRKSISMSAFIIFPLMIGLALISKPLVILFFTENWIEAVPFIQIASITYLIYPINAANIQATTSLGRGNILLKNELLIKVIGFLVLICSIFIFDSTLAIAYSLLISTLISTIISMYPNKVILNYKFKEQFGDLFPSISMSFIMGLFVNSVTSFNLGSSIQMLIQILVGIIVYVSLAILTKNENLIYIYNSIKETLK